MITVSTDYKTAIKSEAKQMKAHLGGADPITGDDDLVSIKITSSGSVCKSIMRQGEVKFLGTHDYLGDIVTLGIGVVVADGSTDWCEYGSFKVTKVNTTKGSDEVTLTLYDSMYEALQAYALTPTYPITLKDLVDQICTALGWTLSSGSATFPNYDFPIASELFTESKLTYRQILDQIAETAGSIIYFNNADQLVIAPVSKTTLAETLDNHNLMTFSVEQKFGVVNSVVLSRSPQEDNIAEVDQESIDENGLTELKFVNNLIVDPDRETAITTIFTQLNDLYFYPFQATTEGLGYLQIGDRIKLKDPANNEYESVITDVTVIVDGGIKETIKSVRPPTTSTNYNYAGIIGQIIKNTEIKVDKQEGEIESLVSDTSGLMTSVALNSAAITSVASRVDQNETDIAAIDDSVSTLEQTADDLTFNISGVGSRNLLKNSSGLKGTSTVEWGAGTVVQTSDVITHTESGSAIQIATATLTQSFATILGESYTFYCRYRTDGNLVINITGLAAITLPSSAGAWVVYKINFTAGATSATLTLSNGAGVTSLIGDMVVKIGDCDGWTPAPNEVYGTNYKFDADGLTIVKQANNFKSVLDNQQLAVYDTSSGSDRTVMQVTKDSGKVTSLTVQTQLTVQRVDNTAKAARFIPTATGMMLVIND